MNNLNSVLIEGNLVRDPEKYELESGTKLCRFSLASNRYYTQDNERKPEVSYFDIEVWNKTAEVCLKTLIKGRGVRVVGRLKQDRWKDQDGKTHSKIKIVGDSVEFRSQFDKKSQEIKEEEEVSAF